MNVEIGTEAGQFPEMDYRNGIFVAVCPVCRVWRTQSWQGWTQLWGSTRPSSLSSSTCSWAPCPTSPWAPSLSLASWSQRKALLHLLCGRKHRNSLQRNTFAHGLNNYADDKAFETNRKHSWKHLPAYNFCGLCVYCIWQIQLNSMGGGVHVDNKMVSFHLFNRD
jgi:hypothetical protein